MKIIKICIFYIMARRGSKKNRRSSKKSAGCGMMWGGNGAADHAIAVYGGIGQQAASQAGGNVIAEKPVGLMQTGGKPIVLSPAQIGGMPVLSPVQLGGNVDTPAIKLPDGMDQSGGDGDAIKLPEGSGQTGGALTDLAVPAILVIANQSMRKRSGKGSFKKKRRSFRKRRSNRRR